MIKEDLTKFKSRLNNPEQATPKQLKYVRKYKEIYINLIHKYAQIICDVCGKKWSGKLAVHFDKDKHYCSSCNFKGERNMFYGKHHTKETISRANKKRIGKYFKERLIVPPKEILIELYHTKGQSMATIGEKYNVSGRTISKWLKQYDINVRKHVFMKHTKGICNESYLEKTVRLELTKNNIVFEVQKKFPTCKRVFQLLFDFYLPDHKMCIEIDGGQHYKIKKNFGGLQGYLKIRHRDMIKDNWCRKNGITLIRLTSKDLKPKNSIIKKFIKYRLLLSTLLNRSKL